MKQGHLIRDCPALAKNQTDEKGFQSSEKRNLNKGKSNFKPVKKILAPPNNMNRFSPLLVEVHDPFDSQKHAQSPQEDEEDGTQSEDRVVSPSSSHSSEEAKSPLAIPESPSPYSSTSEDGEMILDTQLQSFVEKLDIVDQDRRREISSQKSLEVIMTQAEEEALPPGKSKRKKEKNNDAKRAYVQFAKPSKNFKKSS